MGIEGEPPAREEGVEIEEERPGGETPVEEHTEGGEGFGLEEQ